MVLRLLMRQPVDKQRAIVFSTSVNRFLLPDENAIARFIACLRIVFTDLKRLRSGYCQLVKSIQCWITITTNLAYNSHRIRNGFSLRHSSIFPSLFHSLNTNSICQQVRINTKPSSNVRSSDGMLVQITVQPASFSTLSLTVLYLLLSLSAYVVSRLLRHLAL